MTSLGVSSLSSSARPSSTWRTSGSGRLAETSSPSPSPLCLDLCSWCMSECGEVGRGGGGRGRCEVVWGREGEW